MLNNLLRVLLGECVRRTPHAGLIQTNLGQGNPKDLRVVTRLAMGSVARLHRRLSEEIAELDKQIARLVSEAVPALGCAPGCRYRHGGLTAGRRGRQS
jgi:hypothetical protein